MGTIEILPSGRARAIPRHPDTGRKMTLADVKRYLPAVTTLTCVSPGEADALMLRVENEASRVSAGLAPVAALVVPPGPVSTGPGWRWDAYYQDLRSRATWAKRSLTWYDCQAKGISAELENPYLADLAVNPSIIERYRVSMDRNEGIFATMSKTTANARLTVLRRVLRDAYFKRAIDTDLTRVCAQLKGGQAVHRIVDEDELQAILRRTPQRLRAAVLLAHDSGLRREEVAGLHRHRLNLLHREVHVVDVVDEDGSIRSWTKSHRNRMVPLTKRTADALQELMDVQRTAPTGQVFWNANNEPLRDLRSFSRSFGTWATNAGINAPIPTLHDLRHTYGTTMARGGMPINTLRQLMGHKDLATTQVYLDNVGSAEAKAWSRFILEGGSHPIIGHPGRMLAVAD